MTFLPTMIGLSADLRQYPLMLMFSSAGANLLERAFATNFWHDAIVLGIPSARDAFSLLGILVAASLGIYAIFRRFARRPSTGVAVAWTAGRVAGLGLAWFFTQGTLKGWLPDILERKICVMLLTGTFHNFIIILSGITGCRSSS